MIIRCSEMIDKERWKERKSNNKNNNLINRDERVRNFWRENIDRHFTRSIDHCVRGRGLTRKKLVVVRVRIKFQIFSYVVRLMV